MKEMSATEFARNLSAALDSVENGETIVLTRGGQRIASVAPAPRANGAALAEVIAEFRDDPALDDAWAERVHEARRLLNSSAELDRDPWQD